MQTEEKMREQLEEITKELVQLENKKKRTDMIKKNKEFKEIVKKIYYLKVTKENLLNLIQKQHG